MTTYNLFGDNEVWLCDTPAEARELWKSHPADRWRLWLEDELAPYVGAGVSEWRELIARKKERPGRV